MNRAPQLDENQSKQRPVYNPETQKQIDFCRAIIANPIKFSHIAKEYAELRLKELEKQKL